MSWALYDGWNGSRDGNWSTFSLSVGTPGQVIPALISTLNADINLPFLQEPLCAGGALDCSQYSHDKGSSEFQPCGSRTFWPANGCETFSDVFDDGNPELHKVVLNETRRLNGSIRGHGPPFDQGSHTARMGMRIQAKGPREC